MLWKMVAYNPHSAWEFERKAEVATAFCGYHVLGLSGTKYRKHTTDPDCRTSDVSSFRAYEWGHPGKSEHSAGVAIYLRSKVFKPQNVRHIYTIPAEYQGRIGAIRVKRADVDFCFIVVYSWVQGRTAADRTRVDGLWAFVGSIISQLPHRCVPVLFTDCNGKNGYTRDADGCLLPTESNAIGGCTPEVENSNGKAFRELLEHQFMCSVNSFQGPGHTYFGNVAGVQSRIDHVCLPQSLLPHVVASSVLYSVGARLQRVRGPGRRDHMPVHMVFRHRSCFESNTQHQSRKRWDRSQLVNGVLRGDGRFEFVSQVEQRCAHLGLGCFASQEDGSTPPNPDVLWCKLRDAIREPALQLYQEQPRKQQERPTDTKQAIDRYQAVRHSLALMPVCSSIHDDERFLSYEFRRQLLVQWRAVVTFLRARKDVDKLLKRDARVRVCDKVLEFNHAFGRHDHAHVWKCGRELSGFKLGPKRRRYDSPQTSHPGRDEWIAFFENPGNQGGCSGKEVEWDELSKQALEVQLEPQIDIEYAKKLAHRDMQVLVGRMRKCSLRKAVPEWAIPAELWRQLCAPDMCLHPRRHGIGYNEKLHTPNFRDCLHALLLSIRLYNKAPKEWLLSQTVQIDKGNKKTGCEGLRTINVFEPLGKVHAKMLWDRGQRSSQRDRASGYISSKSRITPIMQRRIVKSRLRHSGLSHCDSFYDAKNAFPSVLRSVCDSVIYRTCHPQDVQLLLQRNNECVLHVRAADGAVYIQPGSGSLQGDCHAGAQFLEQYHPTIDEFIASVAEDGLLVATDPVSQQEQDLSISTYADDLSRTIVCQDPEDLLCQLHTANAELNIALHKIGVAQNEDKQEHVPCFMRQNADAYTRFVFDNDVLPGRTRRCSRYLGPLHHATLNESFEIENRIRLADRSWHSMGKVWFRQGLVRASLLLLFSGMVYNTLLSGLEALVLNCGQVQKLDRYVLKRGRRLLRGAACKKLEVDGAWKYEALPTKEVWRKLRLVPTELELCIRRIGYWQNVARHPHLHKSILASVFGHFEFEPYVQVDITGTPSCHANPWLQQFKRDFDTLGQLDSGISLHAEVAGRVLLLFTTFREQFVRIDATELRAKYFGNEVPPPGWNRPPQRDEDIVMPTNVESEFVCSCIDADGNVCGRTFPSYVQLRIHMVHSKGGTHGERPFYAKAAVTNACPWCKHKFSSKVVAASHIKRAFMQGMCTGRGSAFGPELIAPTSMQCPVCEWMATNTSDLLQHLSTHDSPRAYFEAQRVGVPEPAVVQDIA